MLGSGCTIVNMALRVLALEKNINIHTYINIYTHVYIYIHICMHIYSVCAHIQIVVSAVKK